MLGGRFGVGLVRGYQARWVENYKVLPELNAVGPWNAKTEADDMNREYFAEFVDIVVTALKSETMNYQGKFWSSLLKTSLIHTIIRFTQIMVRA